MYISQCYQDGHGVYIILNDLTSLDYVRLQGLTGHEVEVSQAVNKQQLVDDYKKRGMLR